MRELLHDRQQAGGIFLGVGVAVVDFHAVQAGHRVVGALFDVRQENQTAVGPTVSMNAGVGSFMFSTIERVGSSRNPRSSEPGMNKTRRAARANCR